jgi:hypothetical protein
MVDDPIPAFDATDVASEDNTRRDLKRAERDDLDVLRQIMHTKKGRAFILRQLDRCQINSPRKFVPGQPDATAHNLGLEAYGLMLLKDVMAASVDLYMTAIAEEQAEADRKNDVRRAEVKAKEEREKPPSAEDQLSALPPPKGYPGYVAPPDLTRRK